MGLAVAVLALLPACSVNDLSFKRNLDLTFHAPEEGEEVGFPFEVRWELEQPHDSGYVVFFDRPPMRPGKTLESLVADGDACHARGTCPDALWLEDNEVYVTTEPRIVVERLPEERTNNRTSDRHEVTVVLVDGEGRRKGELAFNREFVVERDR